MHIIESIWVIFTHLQETHQSCPHHAKNISISTSNIFKDMENIEV